jgi:hypothetical protein
VLTSAAAAVSATSVSWAKITLTPYGDYGYRHWCK